MQYSLETPEEIRQQIWKELVRATRDRHHPWRTPVLATATRDGSVNARTVVLRKVNVSGASGTLEIYTDRRSGKVAELRQQPNACLVFWSARLNWQLRVRAKFSIYTDGPYVQSLWQSVSQTRAAGDYLSLNAPGAPLPLADDGDSASDIQQTADADPVGHFAVLVAEVCEIDWLELGRANHRRARIVGSQWQWLAP